MHIYMSITPTSTVQIFTLHSTPILNRTNLSKTCGEKNTFKKLTHRLEKFIYMRSLENIHLFNKISSTETTVKPHKYTYKIHKCARQLINSSNYQLQQTFIRQYKTTVFGNALLPKFRSAYKITEQCING